jgi:hypothetical protein
MEQSMLNSSYQTENRDGDQAVVCKWKWLPSVQLQTTFRTKAFPFASALEQNSSGVRLL